MMNYTQGNMSPNNYTQRFNHGHHAKPMTNLTNQQSPWQQGNSRPFQHSPFNNQGGQSNLQATLVTLLNQLVGLLQGQQQSQGGYQQAPQNTQSGLLQELSIQELPPFLIDPDGQVITREELDAKMQQQAAMMQANMNAAKQSRLNTINQGVPIVTAQNIQRMQGDVDRIRNNIASISRDMPAGTPLTQQAMQASQSTLNYAETSLIEAQSIYNDKDAIAQNAYAQGQQLGSLIASGAADANAYQQSPQMQLLAAHKSYNIDLVNNSSPMSTDVVKAGFDLMRVQHAANAFTAGVQDATAAPAYGKWV